jgi:hypothetical protein
MEFMDTMELMGFMDCFVFMDYSLKELQPIHGLIDNRGIHIVYREFKDFTEFVKYMELKDCKEFMVTWNFRIT